jgi:shikimate kinase
VISSRLPIALVGFMGSGKSTIGPALAARLGVTFADLDAALEAASGQSIRTWFETRGEPAFRLAERAQLAAILDRLAAARTGGVIALGGGAWAEPETRDLLAGRARIVWLDVPLETIRSRIHQDDQRPLLGDPVDVAHLYAARQAAYARADVRVDASDAPDAVVERILATLEARFGAQAGES